VVRLVHAWICVEARVDHDAVYEVVHDDGDVVDAAKAVVERGLRFFLHEFLLRGSRPEVDVSRSAAARQTIGRTLRSGKRLDWPAVCRGGTRLLGPLVA
jgi:hypothetical protein